MDMKPDRPNLNRAPTKRSFVIGVLLPGYIAILVLIASIAFVSDREFDHLADLTDQIYKHPLTVSRAVLKANAEMISMHRYMKDVALATNADELQIAVNQVRDAEAVVLEQFDIIRQRYLGNQSEVHEALEAFIAWREIRRNVIELTQAGKVADAAAITKGRGADHVNLLASKMNTLIKFAQNKAVEFKDESKSSQEWHAQLILIGSLVAISIGVLIAGFTIFRISTEIRESEKVQRRLLDAQRLASMGNWEWDIANDKLWWSDEIFDIFDYDPEQFEASYEGFLARVHPSDRSSVNAHVERALNDSEPYSIEHRIVLSDGTERIVHEQAEVSRDAGGKPIWMRGTVQDVTLAREADETVRKLSSAIEQNPAAILITDANGTIEYINREFTKLTGYSKEEALGQTPRLLKSGETADIVYEELWATIKGGKRWRGELRNKTKDGVVYLAGLTVAPIEAADGSITHYVGSSTDITQIAADQNRLKQAEKMEAIGGLAGGIAHDFNNLLLPVLALTKRTRDTLPQDSQDHLRLGKVLEAAEKAKDLVARILAFSRHEDLELENVNLTEVVRETLVLLNSTLPTTVKIKQNLSSEEFMVFGDSAQLSSCLINLANNAADAIGARPGEIEISLSLKEFEDQSPDVPNPLPPGRYAKLEVRDTGHGMDEKTLARIKDPFFTTKEVGKGTGLGVSMVSGIVTKLGGSLDFSSRIGEGTVAHVWLPIAEQQSESEL